MASNGRLPGTTDRREDGALCDVRKKCIFHIDYKIGWHLFYSTVRETNEREMEPWNEKKRIRND